MIKEYFKLHKEWFSKKNKLETMEREFTSANDFLMAIKKGSNSIEFNVYDFVDKEKFSRYYIKLNNNVGILKTQVKTLEFKKKELLKEIIPLLENISKELSITYNRKIGWELYNDTLRFITSKNYRKNEVMSFIIEVTFPKEKTYLILSKNEKTQKKRNFIISKNDDMLNILNKYLHKKFKIKKILEIGE